MKEFREVSAYDSIRCKYLVRYDVLVGRTQLTVTDTIDDIKNKKELTALRARNIKSLKLMLIKKRLDIKKAKVLEIPNYVHHGVHINA